MSFSQPVWHVACLSHGVNGRLIAFLACLAPAWGQVDSPVKAAPQVDPAAIVRQSISNYQRNWQEAAGWAYEETDTTKSDGFNEISITDIMPIDGTPWERIVQKDGVKLSREEQRKEERKFNRAEREREDEGTNQRQARIAKYDDERAFIKDIPSAYTFTLIGEEAVDGRPAWVIQLTRRPGFVPTEPHAVMLAHIEGKLWIDKEDVCWSKAEAKVIDPIDIGWILARIAPGTHIEMEQTRVTAGFWMPKRITIGGHARIFLVRNKPIQEELTFSGFSKPPVTSARNGKPVPGSQSFR